MTTPYNKSIPPKPPHPMWWRARDTRPINPPVSSGGGSEVARDIAVIVLGLVVTVAAIYASYHYQCWVVESAVERVMMQTQGVKP